MESASRSHEAPISGRIAVLADIHANIWALEAVLADAEKQGVDGFIDLGDIAYGALKPRETCERMRGLRFLAQVQGNQDRDIYDANQPARAANPTLDYVLSDLSQDDLEWLRQLPRVAIWEDLLLCHGTPASDTTYLLEDVSSGAAVLKPELAIRELLGPTDSPIVLCGHTHIPRLVCLSNGQMVLNPGSVGLQAYSDDSPVPHVMETHAPHAAYAILERGARGWSVALRRIPYDFQAAATQARRLGRQDWAHALTTGEAQRP
jgi:putative phosphoesterase